MEKRIVSLKTRFLAFCVIVLLIGSNSCRQQDLISEINSNHNRNLTLEEAQSFFNSKVSTIAKPISKIASMNPLAHKHDENCTHNLDKKPMWDGFKYRELSSGYQAVLAPIHKEGTYIGISEDRMVKYGFLNYLMMYKDSANNIITEWVQLKPSLKWFDAKTTRKYDGTIIVKNWDGNVKKVFHYEEGLQIKSNNRPVLKKLASVRGSKMSSTHSDEEEDPDDSDTHCIVTTTWRFVSGKSCPCAGHSYGETCSCHTRPTQDRIEYEQEWDC